MTDVERCVYVSSPKLYYLRPSREAPSLLYADTHYMYTHSHTHWNSSGFIVEASNQF